MMNHLTTLRTSLLCAFVIAGSASAQEWEPELTEVWEPVPEQVTPGEGTAPPSDAIVLFDGSDLSAWEKVNGGDAEWNVDDGALTIAPGTGNIQTRRGFGDMQLHIEWRAPAREDTEGPGQDRGNSGIYLQKTYELQVLDCHDNETYVNGMTGSFYKQYPPLVNPCKPTGSWHTYDIIYTAPRFNEDGSLFSPGTATVLLNGVLVQNNVQLKGPTLYIGIPEYEAHPMKMPIMLQDHGNPTQYRNIWVREL